MLDALWGVAVYILLVGSACAAIVLAISGFQAAAKRVWFFAPLMGCALILFVVLAFAASWNGGPSGGVEFGRGGLVFD